MAKQMLDIGFAPDGDLLITGGDLTIQESTAEHQRSLLLENPGEYKQNPTICVGVNNYIDDDTNSLGRDVVQQFMGDGMKVKNTNTNPAGYTDNTLSIFPNAYYPGS